MSPSGSSGASGPQEIAVEVRRLDHAPREALPAYQTPLSAGVDLAAAVDAPLNIQPGARVLVPSGLAIAMPAGFEAQIRPRSGLALKHGVTVLNSPGTIDSSYRGEVGVLLINHGAEPLSLPPPSSQYAPISAVSPSRLTEFPKRSPAVASLALSFAC